MERSEGGRVIEKRGGDMIKFTGLGIGERSAMGKLYFKKRRADRAARAVGSAEEELAVFREALARASAETDRLLERAAATVGEGEAEIFEIHRMILEDDEFGERVAGYIREGYGAAEAVVMTGEHYTALFAGMEDDYLSARGADVDDLCRRITALLDGEDEELLLPEGSEPFLVVADDLSPSETVSLDRRRIAGFVTFYGSLSSHTAILSRAMDLPALVGVGELGEELCGANAILDPVAGALIVHPDLGELDRFSESMRTHLAREKRLRALVGLPAMSRAGREVLLYANIGLPDEVLPALENDAGGIGLMRSEFLYLGRADYPDEETQVEAYGAVLRAMGGRPVVIRTMDVGADKQADYFDLPREENPALGLRGIRVSLMRLDLFKTQLRALCRASVEGKLAILLPLVVSADELCRARALFTEVKNELRYEDIPFDESIELGVMIETPAAALMSNELARHADFFSVGTNDLLQYTLAADRQNPALARLCEENAEPVLRLIELAAKNAHANGIWIGVCGELAADLSLTERLLEVGVDELSVSPPHILPLKEKIRSL